MATKTRTKTEPAIDYQKLYQLYLPNYLELRKQGTKYANPEIRLGRAMVGSEDKYWQQQCRLVFQVTLIPDEADRDVYQGFRAYGGELQVGWDEMVNHNYPDFGRVYLKARELAPHEECQFQMTLVGLRGLGYRECFTERYSSKIYQVR